jgi:hypothetical protein
MKGVNGRFFFSGRVFHGLFVDSPCPFSYSTVIFSGAVDRVPLILKEQSK